MKPTALRIVAAAIVGGIVWFVWGAFAHMALDFGESSMKRLPDEAAVTSALKATTPDDGIYFFPYWDEELPEDQQMAALEPLYKEGPVGMIVYRRSVDEVMPPSTLLKEFLAGLLASIIAAFVLSRTSWGLLGCASAAAACGVAAWCSHNLSEWIWYGFPWAWIQTAFFEQLIGWWIAGGAMALVLGRRHKKKTAAPNVA